MPGDIGRDEVRRLLEDGAALVEVLPSEEYEAEHIAGAINIPLEEIDRQAEGRLVRDRPVVVYCNDYQ
jgi:rhodanese-related sulfurtransferase